MNYFIRPATPDDINKIIEFTTQEAQESEGSVIDLVAVERGVSSAFCENPRSKYWVMEDSSGTVIANTSVVKEWSDFHGNDYWWIQSFYIAPEHRGMGLADELIKHLTKEAKSEKALELRLYVHGDNGRAIRAYERCGFTESPYTIMKVGL